LSEKITAVYHSFVLQLENKNKLSNLYDVSNSLWALHDLASELKLNNVLSITSAVLNDDLATSFTLCNSHQQLVLICQNLSVNFNWCFQFFFLFSVSV